MKHPAFQLFEALGPHFPLDIAASLAVPLLAEGNLGCQNDTSHCFLPLRRWPLWGWAHLPALKLCNTWTLAREIYPILQAELIAILHCYYYFKSSVIHQTSLILKPKSLC